MPSLLEAANEVQKIGQEEAYRAKVADQEEARANYGRAVTWWRDAAASARRLAQYAAANAPQLDPPPGAESRAQQYESNALRAQALIPLQPKRLLLNFASMRLPGSGGGASGALTLAAVATGLYLAWKRWF